MRYAMQCAIEFAAFVAVVGAVFLMIYFPWTR